MLDLDNTTIIVSGTPRSGTTLMMRLLHAGGIDALVDDALTQPISKHADHGVWELFNVGTRIRDGGPEFTNGRCVKLLAPFITWWPLDRETRCIFMLRPIADITASLLTQGKTWDLTPAQMMNMARSYIEDHGLSVHYVQYNDLIKYPRSTCHGIAEFLDLGLNIDAMVDIINKPKEDRSTNPELEVWNRDKLHYLLGSSPEHIE